MCGIYGMIFHHGVDKRYNNRLQVFWNVLSVTSADRGTDATGVARCSRQGNVGVYKDVLPSYDMIKTATWQSYLASILEETTHAAMGHTRKKSVGLNTQPNAHPFVFDTRWGQFVGMHNGTISNHIKFAPADACFAVDSANLLWSLSQLDKNKWAPILEKVDGSFALAYARKDSVYLARNSGSPCWRAFVPSFGATVYASVPHMFLSAAAMAGVQLDSIAQLKPGRVYEFTAGRKRCLVSKFKDTYKEPSVYGCYGGWVDETDNASTSVTSAAAVVTTPTTSTTANTLRRKHYICNGCQNWFGIEGLMTFTNGKRYCDPCSRTLAVLPVSATIRAAILEQARQPEGLTRAQAERIAFDTSRGGV